MPGIYCKSKGHYYNDVSKNHEILWKWRSAESFGTFDSRIGTIFASKISLRYYTIRWIIKKCSLKHQGMLIQQNTLLWPSLFCIVHFDCFLPPAKQNKFSLWNYFPATPPFQLFPSSITMFFKWCLCSGGILWPRWPCFTVIKDHKDKDETIFVSNCVKARKKHSISLPFYLYHKHQLHGYL